MPKKNDYLIKVAKLLFVSVVAIWGLSLLRGAKLKLGAGFSYFQAFASF